MAWRIEPFQSEHASAAAEIHAEGQPGTFLTRLGPRFLRALYAQMANSSHCVGFVALEEVGERVAGVVMGTVDSGRLFKEVIRARGLALAPSVCLALVRDPFLLRHVLETLTRPNPEDAQPGEAELLFIGVRPGARGQGLGKALFQRLTEELGRRKVESMGLVVDDANATAQAFYRGQGMHPMHSLTMYGRLMHWYRLSLASQGEATQGETPPIRPALEPVRQVEHE
jgi:ribosomal protein S18 acetylase RimI-like enzyme